MPASESSSPQAALSVGEAAARIGVAASTLRTWQRRYGLTPAERSSGGHRRYLPADVAVLEHMHRLVLEGLTPASAARVALARSVRAAPDSITNTGPVTAATFPGPVHSPGPGPAPATGQSTSLDSTRAAKTSARPATMPPGRRARGGPGGRVLAVPGATPAARGLARAATRLDGAGCIQVIEASLTAQGVEATWDLVLRPVLVSAGAHWARTGQGVEIEHLLTEATIEALRSYRRSCPRADGRPPALLACAPADQHSLPLYAVAAALAERGVASHVLGARVPGVALSAAMTRTRSRAIFIWAQLPDPRNASVTAELPTLRPRPTVVLGGPGWVDPAPAGAVHAHSLSQAAQLLAPSFHG